MATPTPDLQSLMLRLEKLERKNRWLTRLVVVLLLLAGTGLLMGSQQAARPKVTDLGSVVLRDGSGRQTGWMNVRKEGLAWVFADDEGRPASGLALSRDGAALTYFQANGLPHSGLSVEQSGVAIGYRDATGNPLIGNNAVKNVLGKALENLPLYSRPQQKPAQ
jgi:hypothetical protein